MNASSNSSKIEWTYECFNECIVCQGQLTQYDWVDDSLIHELNAKIPPHAAKLPALRNQRVICQHCRLIFLSPRLKTESLTHIYTAWYAFAYQQIFQDNTHITQREKEFTQYHLKFLNKHATKPGKLLDIGCGSGLFLKLARDIGWQGLGVEFNERSAQFGADNYDLTIVNTLEKLDKTHHRSFDAITMFDYLEHSNCPKKDIEYCKTLLKDNGLLLIRVPNQASLQARLMGKHWLAILSNHLSYFDKHSLNYLLNSQGFEIKFRYAGNFRKESDILKEKGQFLINKTAKTTSSNNTSCKPTAAASSLPKFRRVLEYIYGAMMEQVDHFGGLIGMGNNLFVIARKSSED